MHYLNGFGVEKDYKKAKEYFEQSAHNKNAYAYLMLGIMYEFGFLESKDYSKAIEYYKLSCNKIVDLWNTKPQEKLLIKKICVIT